MDAEQVNHDSGLPEHLQVAGILRRQIETGRVTKRLVSERTLAQVHDVSVGTVRKALRLLREEGLIETHRGYGSRVIPPEERKQP